MLAIFRKSAQHIVVRGFLFVLAAMFIVWGVGDIFRGKSSNSVASIGNSSVDIEEFNQLYREELKRFQAMTGNALTEEEIAQSGIKNHILQRLIDRHLVLNRIEDLGITVGNETIAWQLQSIPTFQNEKGEFDRRRFLEILNHSGISEKNFVDSEKQESSVSLLISVLLADPVQPESLTKKIYNWQNEKRVADIITIPSNLPITTEDPTEEDLVQYYQEHTKEFITPETRSVTYISFSPSDIKKEVIVSEEELKREYESHIEEFALPEQRNISQYLAENEKNADEIWSKIMAGHEINEKPEDIGNVTKDSLPPELQEAIFSTAAGQYTIPIKTDLGIHIVKINTIHPSGVRSLEEVRNDLKERIKEEKKSNLFYEFSEQLEDDLAAGTTLETLAQKHQLSLQKIRDLTKEGNPDGNTTSLPDKSTFINLIFGLEAGIESSLTQLPNTDTYLIARVDTIQPERTQALDEVRGSAILQWKDNQKKKQYAIIAEKARQHLKSGDNTETTAALMHLKLTKNKTVARPTEAAPPDKEIPLSLSQEIFSLKKGEATKVHISENGAIVAVVNQIITPENKNKEEIAQLQKRLELEYINETLQQYSAWLQELYPVEIHSNILNIQ